MLMDFRDNVQKCHEYIQALEEERSKIQVFRRELPLCVELVTQAIEACKQQLSGTSTNVECLNGHSECSEQTTSNEPVLEEFMPLINRSNSTDIDDENEHESKKQQMINNTQISNDDHDNRNDDDDDDDDNNNNDDDELEKKSDWLRSVQLWNQTPDLPTTTHKENQPKRVSVVEIKKNGGAFHPFQKEKTSTSGNNNSNNNNNKPSSAPAASACSSAEVAGGGKKEEKGGQSSRKARRCWSPELHRRFLHALQQLGGSHVATPKQIKEMMKVDGLTNDEVKSHLQKYRLHTRRPTPSIHNTTTTTQTPQFVVVGGIWMPAATTVGPSNGGVYAPVAAAPPPPTLAGQSQSHYCEERGSHSEGRRATTTTGRSSSPATSSSTHTTTASHAS